MGHLFSLIVAGVIAAGVLFNGGFYVVAPARALGSFGLKPPAADPDTYAWLRLKGVRDVGAGAVVLCLMMLAERRTLGIVLLAFAIIPFGDMSVILGSGGSKRTAYFVHGLTCVAMVIAGVLLLRVA